MITSLARLATAAGLVLHPYTFRADELPKYTQSLEDMLELFLSVVGVQGVFCDHTDIAVRVRDTLAHRPSQPNVRGGHGQLGKTLLK